MELQEFLAEWHQDSPRVLVHTSGSTGKPKPMWVEKQRMLNSARITCDFLGLQEGDTALLCMPLDYIAGKMVVVRSIERRLRLFAVKPSGHPLADASLLPDHLTFAAMVPMQVYNSLQNPDEAERLRNIDHLIIGGGAIDEALEKELRQFPNAVWSTYGMTETLSHIALRRLNGDTASDYYQPFDSVAVSSDDDGCLVIDAPLVHEGKLVTHDRVEIVPEKGFRILGRKDNVIDSGGIKIQIEEVEAALKPHLAAPYLITKRSDRKFGETVVLLTEDKDTDSVQAICCQVLPKFWQPHVVITVDRIPMTETGKPARSQAVSIAAAWKETEKEK